MGSQRYVKTQLQQVQILVLVTDILIKDKISAILGSFELINRFSPNSVHYATFDTRWLKTLT